MIRHLYVHVPFCLRRCSYCDFAVTALSVAPTDAWLEAIARELRTWREQVPDLGGSALDTIYVGGGTPSLMGGEGLHGLAGILANHFTWHADIEWTSEANPETLTEDVARGWIDAGVNRLSLGAQTFNEEILRWMGRVHGPDGPGRAVAAARKAGFGNLSLDLIFGLPSRFQRDWAADLDRVIELGPEHVSLYGLTAEKNTPLGRWVAEGRETLGDEEQYVAEYLLAIEKLGAAGYEHYEVSNFSRPGLASRHNRAYWIAAPYIGLGPGAHSFVPPRRSWNVRDWAEYSARLRDGRPAREGHEDIGESAASLERSWLGLRTRDGLLLAELSPAQRERVLLWSDTGLAIVNDGTARLTPQGWLLLDRLVIELESV